MQCVEYPMYTYLYSMWLKIVCKDAQARTRSTCLKSARAQHSSAPNIFGIINSSCRRVVRRASGRADGLAGCITVWVTAELRSVHRQQRAR